ncbi:MAG TPA: hypothetical protein VHX65_01665 [Pirellulales bacterium]|jgi:hypothetical protein|nr:hypothetical protein [Pirellulales bacterium]
MSTTIQTVTLSSKGHFGRNVPPKAFGELLRAIPDAIRLSVRMAFESRSRATGKLPKWLAPASDIRFLDHGGHDETFLHFEVPRLGDAAAEIYRQQELWPTRPDPEDTGFDLLGDVISDVAASDVDSERFDRPLLRQIERFSRGLNGTFQRLAFPGNRFSQAQPVVINSAVIGAASKLCHGTPEPQQTRVAGKLDMIRSSTNTFAIKLKDGQDIHGVLNEGKIADFKGLLEQNVLVLGKAVYRPSGKLLRIDADHVSAAAEWDQFFSTIPKPKRSRFDLRGVLREQQHKNGMTAVFGKWPGNETDEQIAAALREMS